MNPLICTGIQLYTSAFPMVHNTVGV